MHRDELARVGRGRWALSPRPLAFLEVQACALWVMVALRVTVELPEQVAVELPEQVQARAWVRAGKGFRRGARRWGRRGPTVGRRVLRLAMRRR